MMSMYNKYCIGYTGKTEMLTDHESEKGDVGDGNLPCGRLQQ